MFFIIFIFIIGLCGFLIYRYKVNKNKFNKIMEHATVGAFNNDGSAYIAFDEENVYSNYFDNGETPRKIKDTVFYFAQDNTIGIILDQIYPITKIDNNLRNQFLEILKNYPASLATGNFIQVTFGQQSAEELKLSWTKAFLYKTNSNTKKFRITADLSRKEYTLVNIDFNPKYATTYNTVTQGRTGSAIAGGLLAGPAGAVIGSARKRKSTTTTSTKEKPSYAMMTLIDNDGNSKDVAILTYQSSVNFIRVKFLSRENQINSKTSMFIDSADEIAKFKKLLDTNAITQEEFEAKKKQLLKL
ncbi:SHOCT domain-containing protein [Limosilactobacillus reuteri]|nr:SHOCT domain-containing protein [Limosilactobacillus reuteri]